MKDSVDTMTPAVETCVEEDTSGGDADVSSEFHEPDVPERFHVHDDDTANWVVRKIVEAREYRKRVDIWAEREKARAAHEERFFLFRFEPQLRTWAAKKMTQTGGRRKAVFLPAGTLAFRIQPSRLVFDNETLVIDWAREHCPNAVQNVERLSRSVVTDHFKTTGELPVAGVHVEPERENFRVS